MMRIFSLFSTVAAPPVFPYQAPLPPQPQLCTLLFKQAMQSLFAPINKAFTCVFFPAALPQLFPRWMTRSIPPYNSFIQRMEEEQSALRARAEQEGGEVVSFQHCRGMRLEGALFSAPAARKILLYVGGRNSCWERSYHNKLSLARQVGDVGLFVFNPPSVGRSDAASINATVLAESVYSAFCYLVNVHGIDPNDIVIFGHSLGGGYGVLGAALVQEAYPGSQIHCVSHNSFSSITQLIAAYVPSKLRSVLQLLTHALDWEMDVVSAVRKLLGKKLVIVNKADEVIPYRTASLYTALKVNAQVRPFFQVTRLKMMPQASQVTEGVSHHSRKFNAWEHCDVLNHLREMFSLPFTPSIDPSQELLSYATGAPYHGLIKSFYIIERLLHQLREEGGATISFAYLREALALIDKTYAPLSFNPYTMIAPVLQEIQCVYEERRHLDIVEGEELFNARQVARLTVALEKLRMKVALTYSLIAPGQGWELWERAFIREGNGQISLANLFSQLLNDYCNERSALEIDTALRNSPEFGRSVFCGQVSQIPLQIVRQISYQLRERCLFELFPS